MAKAFTEDDDALLAELGVEVEVKKHVSRTLSCSPKIGQ